MSVEDYELKEFKDCNSPLSEGLTAYYHPRIGPCCATHKIYWQKSGVKDIDPFTNKEVILWNYRLRCRTCQYTDTRKGHRSGLVAFTQWNHSILFRAAE